MAREPVAIDFIGLGERGVGLMGSHGAIECDDRGSRATRLVRPVPSVPEFHQLADAQAMSRMTPISEGFRNWDTTRVDRTSPFARPGAGLCRPPWVNKHAMAMRQLRAGPRSEESSGLTVESSHKRELSEGHSVGHSPSPSLPAWDLHSAPASPSHHTMSSSNRFEVFAQQLAQQARKAASMYADPQQALRNNVSMRTSPLGDEAHVGVHQSTLSGAEPSSVSHPHPSSSSQSTGFGSPVPFYSRSKGNSGVESGVPSAGHSLPHPQQQQHAVQEANMAAAHALARPPTFGKQPRSAQLTIFYSGMVNVYDEVPFDKAQAIMLLAGKGSTWFSNNINVPGISCGASERPVSTPTSRAGSPAPPVTTTSVGAPPPGSVPINSNRLTPTSTTVELPQARKASLARFLERRKDRVRKGPYTQRNNELATHEALMRLNRENSLSPSSSSRPPTRTLSPPSAGNHNNNSPFNAIGAANMHGASTSGTGEPNSPKLPTTPPRQSLSQETSHEVIPRCENSQGINVASPSRGKAAVATETEHSS